MARGQVLDAKLLARSTPAGFAHYASGGAWKPAPHLLLLSRKLVEVATGRCPRLMVFMPPRHGKSELISKYTPAWFLGRFPTKKVMLASYSDNFAATWGRSARGVLEQVGMELFGVRVDSEAKGGAQWELDRKSPVLQQLYRGRGDRGVMVTAGVGGGLTGKGADILIIDDPVKNAEEAHSEAVRQSHHDWWKSTARTRLMPDAGVVLVMTRWHEDDLAGRLLRDQLEGDGDHWDLLVLPGVAEQVEHPTSGIVLPDPLGRADGEALWPSMFNLDAIEQTRRAMGTYWFTAMYQQRPSPLEGALFKRRNFLYYERNEPDANGQTICVLNHRDAPPSVFDPSYGRKFCTVDVAASEKQQADFTVVSTWVVTPNLDMLLWDRERVQFEGPDLAPFIKRIFYEQQPSIVGIERLGHGLQIIQELLRQGLPIVRLEPDKDKVARALPAAARYEEGRIFHPRGAPWLHEWEDELIGFPNMKNDDQVDTVAYAAMQLPHVGTGRRDAGWMQRAKGTTITGGMMSAEF